MGNMYNKISEVDESEDSSSSDEEDNPEEEEKKEGGIVMTTHGTMDDLIDIDHVNKKYHQIQEQ
jgi:hypothetical protein